MNAITVALMLAAMVVIYFYLFFLVSFHVTPHRTRYNASIDEEHDCFRKLMARRCITNVFLDLVSRGVALDLSLPSVKSG